MKRKQLLFTLIAAGLLLAACGGARAPETREDLAPAAESPAEMEMAGAEQQASSEQSVEGKVMATAAPTVIVAGNEAVNAPGNAAQLSVVPETSRMVIKDAELELLVQNTDRAIGQVNQAAADYGGYLISSQTWQESGFKYASIRLGVPVTSFESALNHIRNLGLVVLKETASGQDVTAAYVDLETRLTNLQATAARVRSFLAEADNIEEMLQISAQLSQIEAEIEQIGGQMRFYEGRSAFSTITVLITPQIPTPTPAGPRPTPRPWTPADSFQGASNQLIEMTQDLVDFLIWTVIGYAPVLVILALVIIAARRLARQLSGTGKKAPVSVDED